MRLGDLDALMERMREQAGCRRCNSYAGVRCRAYTWEDAMDLADEAPTIYAVPVVRCKDCKYWHRDDPVPIGKLCKCYLNGCWWLPEDYCSCGELREADGKEGI